MTPVWRSAKTLEVPPGVRENRRFGDAGAWRESVELRLVELLATVGSIGVTAGGGV